MRSTPVLEESDSCQPTTTTIKFHCTTKYLFVALDGARLFGSIGGALVVLELDEAERKAWIVVDGNEQQLGSLVETLVGTTIANLLCSVVGMQVDKTATNVTCSI
jgi:hypothetical protein